MLDYNLGVARFPAQGSITHGNYFPTIKTAGNLRTHAEVGHSVPASELGVVYCFNFYRISNLAERLDFVASNTDVLARGYG